MMMMMMMNFR